jgi:hypothetical protein
VANPNGTPGNLLAPWKKGQSGNPLGRPKGRVSLTKILQDRLKDRHFLGQPTPDDRLVAEWLIDAMIGHAVTTGNANLFQQILDRNDGKLGDPEPQVDVTMEAVAAIEAIGDQGDTSEGSEGTGGVQEQSEPIQ